MSDETSQIMLQCIVAFNGDIRLNDEQASLCSPSELELFELAVGLNTSVIVYDICVTHEYCGAKFEKHLEINFCLQI